MTVKKIRMRAALAAALVFAVAAAVFPLLASKNRVTGAVNTKIKLYDGEEKRVIGEISMSDLRSYSRYLETGEIIWNINSSSDGGNFLSEINGPCKKMKAEDGTEYCRIFGGWYMESPTKLYVSNWNWDESNSIEGLALFDADGTPNKKLYNEKKDDYRIYAYWIPDTYFRPVVSYRDGRAGDGLIDELYVNACVPRGDIFTEAGFIIDDSPVADEKKMTIDGSGSPLYVERGVEMYRSVRESGCYDFDITLERVTGFTSNGYADDGRVMAFHWQGINAFDSFSVRVYLVTRDGSVVYGPITKVQLTDGGELLPIKP